MLFSANALVVCTCGLALSESKMGRELLGWHGTISEQELARQSAVVFEFRVSLLLFYDGDRNDGSCVMELAVEKKAQEREEDEWHSTPDLAGRSPPPHFAAPRHFRLF